MSNMHLLWDPLQRDPRPGPIERARMLRWDERLTGVDLSVSTQEPILALRRQLAHLMDDTDTVAKCWLLLAKRLRAAAHYGHATLASLMAIQASSIAHCANRKEIRSLSISDQ